MSNFITSILNFVCCKLCKAFIEMSKCIAKVVFSVTVWLQGKRSVNESRLSSSKLSRAQYLSFEQLLTNLI